MYAKYSKIALLSLLLIIAVTLFATAPPLSPLQAEANPFTTFIFQYSSSSDGTISKYGSSYDTIRDAVSGTVESERIYVGQYKDPSKYELFRSFVFFDTSELPDGCNIISATLYLYTAADGSSTDFDVVIQNGQLGYPHEPLIPDDYERTHYSGNGGSFNTVDLTSKYNYNAIPLNSDGLSWIVATGTTKFCLRSSRDIGGITPTGLERVEFYAMENEEYAPKLEVTIERPPATIDITASADITGWELSPLEEQPKKQQGTLTVTTAYADDIDWMVMVSDDDPQTSGHMTKWNETSGYDSQVQLQTALQVQGPAVTVTLPLPTGGVVVQETGTVTAQGYPITFEQEILWADLALSDADSYRIVVTFTATIL